MGRLGSVSPPDRTAEVIGPTEVDVLIVGFGAAGASAAIEAHDAGASVAIVEKSAAGGGNCVYSGGFLFEIEGPNAIEHLDALCFGKTDRGVLDAYARGLPNVWEFLRELGGSTECVDIKAFGGMLPSWPHFPGAGCLDYRQFVPVPGERPGPGLWCVLERAVAARKIPVALNTSAVELTLDGGRVTGAIVQDTGQRRAIAAGAGVILAQAAGASLWHMSAFFGWLAFVRPDYPAGFTLDVHAQSFIYVDGDGYSFADETGWEVHDRVRALTAYLPRRRNRPRMPGCAAPTQPSRSAARQTTSSPATRTRSCRSCHRSTRSR
jgi:succinate dehydrogenase/fumarate reductase flavoprotein subunit